MQYKLIIFSTPGLDYYSMWNKRKHMYITIVYWRMVVDQKWGLADLSRASSRSFPKIVSLPCSHSGWKSTSARDSLRLFLHCTWLVSHRELIYNIKRKNINVHKVAMVHTWKPVAFIWPWIQVIFGGLIYFFAFHIFIGLLKRERTYKHKFSATPNPKIHSGF